VAVPQAFPGWIKQNQTALPPFSSLVIPADVTVVCQCAGQKFGLEVVDLLKADKIAWVCLQDFCDQGLAVFPGMGTILGKTEPEIESHDCDRIIGPVFVLFRRRYGKGFYH